MERAILSVVHQYRTLIKINFSSRGSRHVIKGHIISFDHNAPQKYLLWKKLKTSFRSAIVQSLMKLEKVDEVACIHNNNIRDDDVARVRQNESQDEDTSI
eukprot:13301575-Ditylum_brightwellii.AAC.1